MENPEEVLMALDRFQKVRPSEIPRELEEYLCWVAKTGDPVYQWGLIKVLFREKLLRVMTEFNENCPTLDLTPCPNVEQFNYDTMKRNLLERLESFANAPFTVQRICELLTVPRKEYNRIDKFMRAIEKNILVVSTREPGPYGRRSENGDNLVNGSVEDESCHHGQGSNDVDMDNWVKDCTSSTAAPANKSDIEDMSVENGLNTTFTKEDRIDEQLSAVDATASSFVSSTADFPTAAVVTAQTPAEEAEVAQNLATVNHDATAAAGIVGDVSDVIMNEDTSSQPSLELESDENDSSDSKKLQTTFQAKDFTLNDEKVPKIYSEELKEDKSEESTESAELNKESDQLTVESTLSDKTETAESTESPTNSSGEDSLIVEKESSQVEEKTDADLSEKNDSDASAENYSSRSNDLDTNKTEMETNEHSEATEEVKCNTNVQDESKTESITVENAELTKLENPSKETSEELISAEKVSEPIVDEPSIETTDSSDSAKPESVELTIEETEENISKAKLLVPDSIPTVEEPKEPKSEAKDWESALDNSAVEVTKEEDEVIKNGIETAPVEQADQSEDNQKGKADDSMDIENERLLANVSQDEPMEEDTTKPIS